MEKINEESGKMDTYEGKNGGKKGETTGGKEEIDKNKNKNEEGIRGKKGREICALLLKMKKDEEIAKFESSKRRENKQKRGKCKYGYNM